MRDVRSVIDSLREEKRTIIAIREEISDEEYERMDRYLAAEGRIDQAIEQLRKEVSDGPREGVSDERPEETSDE